MFSSLTAEEYGTNSSRNGDTRWTPSNLSSVQTLPPVRILSTIRSSFDKLFYEMIDRATVQTTKLFLHISSTACYRHRSWSPIRKKRSYYKVHNKEQSTAMHQIIQRSSGVKVGDGCEKMKRRGKRRNAPSNQPQACRHREKL